MSGAAILTAAALSSATLLAQDGNFGPGPNNPLMTTTVTNATGTITQINYGPGGAANGFLIGTNTLLLFPSAVAGGVASLGAAGNSVTYSGAAVAASSGFESVRISSFTNNSTKAAYTAPASGPAPAAYGPTSGTVKQLNYDPQGNIDGFVFLPSGTTASIFVQTPPQAAATLKPLLVVNATVSVTGVSEMANPGLCVSTGALAVVDATSLTVNGQTIVIAGGGPGGGRPGPGGPRH